MMDKVQPGSKKSSSSLSSSSFSSPPYSSCCGGQSHRVTLPDPIVTATTTAIEEKGMPRFKVVMLGDWGCGKTCLFTRFTENTFRADQQNEIKSVSVAVGEVSVRLIIWDTGGQEKFRSLTTSYYRDASAVMLVYDITNRESFDSLSYWSGQVKLLAPSADIYILVGTKVDAAAEDRRVSVEEGQVLAENLGAHFVETSSKEGTNVAYCLSKLAEACLSKWRDGVLV